MATTPPPNNSKPVWFTPRDGSGDKVLYYLRDGRTSKHAGLAPLTPHPLAASNPIYEGLVFLNRTPADDEEAGLVKDWYGPSSLVDDLLSVRDAGGGYESSLLYARGTTPPDEDTRIDVLGRQTLNNIGPVSVAWVNDPLTSSPGIDLALMTDVSTLEGDEVYIIITPDAPSEPAFETLFGINVSSKRLKIVRHISSTSVHVEVPYNSSVDLSDVHVAADVYEALYLLDGYTDAETAPGVLSGLFHTRTFSYRLAEPSYSPTWDETLGLQFITEQRAFPSSWARTLAGASLSSATVNSSITYEIESKLIAIRSKRTISGAPDQDELEWSSRTRITVPAICYGVDVPYCWSWVAIKDDEDEWRQDYAAAYAITKSTLNSHEVGVATRTVRRILPESGVKAFVDALGHPYSFTTSTAQINVRATWYFAGANIGAGAMIRTATIGPCLLGGAHSGKILVKVPEDEGAKNIKKSPEGIYPSPASEAIAEAADRAADSATATVTITNYTELNSGDKINLIAADGTNHDFTNGSQSSVAGTWESATSNDQTATNLMNVINTGSGPSGTRFSASVAGAVVTITQATSGSAGNTEVTLTDTGTAGMSKTDFIGGGPGSGAASGSENVLSPGMSKWYTGQKVPWESEVLWDVKTEKGRWGYWVVDITYLTLPPDPVRNLFPARFIKALDNPT